jgi:hypothetical protein
VTPEPAPPAEALTSATVRARRIQPTTSLPTPAARTTVPTVVSRSLHSVRMRQRTGNAVMDMAVPTKRRKWPKFTVAVSMNVW